MSRFVQCPICSKDIMDDAWVIDSHMEICTRTSDPPSPTAHDKQNLNMSSQPSSRKRSHDGGYEVPPAAKKTSHQWWTASNSGTHTSNSGTHQSVGEAVTSPSTPKHQDRPSLQHPQPPQQRSQHHPQENRTNTDTVRTGQKLHGIFSHRSEQDQSRHLHPLADRIRPKTLEDVVGQPELLGEGSLLRRVLDNNHLPSLVLWGPPGTGKTTLARIISKSANAKMFPLSAVTAGLQEVRKVIQEASALKKNGRRSVLFLDEIHRFNKMQQDSLLPHVENGTVVLIATTTENPSFEVNAALLSRCQVMVLEKLSNESLIKIVRNGAQSLGVTVLEKNGDDNDLSDNKDSHQSEKDTSMRFELSVVRCIADLSDGDARSALNVLELVVNAHQGSDRMLTASDVLKTMQRKNLTYDKSGEEHFNIISALHKSMRGGDPDASIYWMGRMLEAGENPLYVARRVIRFASEDVGLADPQGMLQAVAAYQACHYLGMPECALSLAQAVVYLAKAPKSNQLEVAYNNVKAAIEEKPRAPVPMHIRNAPTQLMKRLGYGKGYKYNPNFTQEETKDQRYLPDELDCCKFFTKAI